MQRIVRPSRLEDKPQIEELLQNSYKILLADDYRDSGVLEKALPKITGVRDDLLTCGTWYVVEEILDTGSTEANANVIIGCGGWTPKSPLGSDDSPPHLRHFATHPEYLRQGVANSLWNKIRQDVCQHFHVGKTPAMEVYSTLTAESFYASLGFQSEERVTLPLGNDCDFPCILMRRPSE